MSIGNMQILACDMLKCVFVSRKKCSTVGRDRSRKYQQILISKRNKSMRHIIHNIFHVLGRYHEDVGKAIAYC